MERVIRSGESAESATVEHTKREYLAPECRVVFVADGDVLRTSVSYAESSRGDSRDWDVFWK